MKRAVVEYDVLADGEVTMYEFPIDSQIMDVVRRGTEYKMFVIWDEQDHYDDTYKIVVKAFRGGETMDPDWVYMSTVVADAGSFVRHFFYKDVQSNLDIIDLED